MKLQSKRQSNPKNGLTNIQEDTEEYYCSPDFTLQNQSQNSHLVHLPSGNLTPTNELRLQQQIQNMNSQSLAFKLQQQKDASSTMPLSEGHIPNDMSLRQAITGGGTPGQKIKMQAALNALEMRSNNYSASTQAYNQASEKRQIDLTPQSRRAQAEVQNQFNSNTVTPKVGRSPSQNGRRSSITNNIGRLESETKTPGQHLQFSSEKQVPRRYELSEENQPDKHMQVIHKASLQVLKGDVDEEYQKSILESGVKVQGNLIQKEGDFRGKSTKKQTNKKKKKNDDQQVKVIESRSRQVRDLISSQTSSKKNIQRSTLKSAKKQTTNLDVIVDTSNTIQSQGDLTSEVEAWKYTSNTNTRDARTHKESRSSSFEDSDIADEFEYIFDPNYQKNKIRLMSPQAVREDKRALQGQGAAWARKASAGNPNAYGKQNLTSIRRIKQDANLDTDRLKSPNQSSPLRSSMMNFFNGLEEFEKYELIRRTCKDTKMNLGLEAQKNFRARKDNFISRMLIDVSQRDTRDKSFQELQYIVAMKQNHDYNSIANKSRSPERRDHSCLNHKTQGDLSAISPNKNQSVRDRSPNQQAFNQLNNTNMTVYNQQDLNNLSPLFTSPTRSLQNIQSMLQSPSTSRKKLKKQECEQIFERLMTKEAGRQQAIEMLQEAKRKDEDAEYLQSTCNSKILKIILIILERITKRQKQRCHLRLAEDADRRKITQVRSQQQEQERQLKYIKENQFRARQISQRRSDQNAAKAPRKIKKVKKNKIEVVNSDWQQNLGELTDLNQNLLQQQMQYEQRLQYEQFLQLREQKELQDHQQIVSIQSKINAEESQAQRSESSNYGEIPEDDYAHISAQKLIYKPQPYPQNFYIESQENQMDSQNDDDNYPHENQIHKVELQQQEQGFQEDANQNEFDDDNVDEDAVQDNNLQDIDEISKDSITDEYYNE